MDFYLKFTKVFEKAAVKIKVLKKFKKKDLNEDFEKGFFMTFKNKA
jgi:hypothetical protein